MPRRDADSMGGGTVGGWTARRGRRGRWWRGTTAAYVDFRLTYDRDGSITSESDELVARKVTGGAWTAGDHYFDRVFTNDNLNRLAKADEGKMSGASIASSKHTRTEEWILSQTGNWANQKLDLNGDGDQADSSERDWNATFNAANECTARGGVTPTTPYDEVGNMIDDAVNYTYVYDVFGRLKTVKTRGGSPVTVSEYTYNGLGHRVGWHYDADTDADVDGSDPWYWFFYDERWRMVATYRASDANPKERFVYHNAGLNGYGGSSYIDSTILRDTDDAADWVSAAPDSTLQTRYYYLQNWRADVVALIQPDGDPIEYVRYSAYGVPYVYGAGDVNRDGVVDIVDVYSWDDYYYYTTGDAAVDIDVNRDGTVDGDDYTLVFDQDASWQLWQNDGRGFVSRLDSRKGYAGYEFDPATTQWHVRHRVLVSEMGRWGRRDPLSYRDGNSSYQYVQSIVLTTTDATGLMSRVCGIGMPCGILNAPITSDGAACATTTNSLDSCLQCCSAGGPPTLACITACNFVYDPMFPITRAPKPPCAVPDNPAWSNQEACDAIAAGCKGNKGGFVGCRGGQPFSCVVIPSPVPPVFDGPAGGILRGCIEANEDTHHDDVDCTTCPAGSVCKPGWKAGRNVRREECISDIASIQCLDRRRRECYDAGEDMGRCLAAVDSFKRGLCALSRTHCGSEPAECSR